MPATSAQIRSVDERDHDEDEPEHGELAARRAIRVDELRQEGEEEERRLRVQDVDDDALAVRARRRRLGARPADPVVALRSVRIPSQTRYAAPASFTAVNAAAEAARTAESADRRGARRGQIPPVETPSAETTPARRPPWMLCATM